MTEQHAGQHAEQQHGDLSAAQLRENLEAVRERIRAAERAANREPGSVALLPVTKFHGAGTVEALAAAGVRLVGENREQEARAKAETLATDGVDCGIVMIGQIQSKKANAVARWASEVHSVDSVKLARGLDRGMALAIERGDRRDGAGDVLRCLVQVSADGDTSRGGVALDGASFGGVAAEETVSDVVGAVEDAEHLAFDGFMVVPPLDAEPGEVFALVRQLTDEWSAKLGRTLRMSAGMSGDFELAIAHGSDVVRVGTAVVGPRPVG